MMNQLRKHLSGTLCRHLAMCCIAGMVIAGPLNTQTAEPDKTIGFQSPELQAWFLDKLCTSLKRNTGSYKRFRSEDYLRRVCADYGAHPPLVLFPSQLTAILPGDAEYPVGPGLDRCDVVPGEENTCDMFASVCLTRDNGVGWCDDEACWCEYDPPEE
ncbi:MAG: hypothetical protein AB3N15_01285 [Paracoccaceae bacterium]